MIDMSQNSQILNHEPELIIQEFCFWDQFANLVGRVKVCLYD